MKKFWQNVIKVASRSVFSQGLAIVTIPLLTRLYSPASFGSLALFVAVCGVLATIINGRFDVAIPIPKDEKDGWDILQLCVTINIILSSLVFTVIWIFPFEQFSDFEHIRFIVPLQIFMMGALTSFSYWLTRQGCFSVYAIAGVVQVLISLLTQITLGFMKQGAAGLIVGQAVGTSIALLITFLYSLFFAKPEDGSFLTFKRMIKVARANKDNPLFLIPAHFVNSFAANYPVLFLSQHYGQAVTGMFHLANKVVIAPSMLIGTSIGQVFYPEAAKSYAEKHECIELFHRIIKILSVTVLPLSIIVAIGGFYLAGPIFGQGWDSIGVMISILALGNMIRFINSPVSGLWMISGNQRKDLLWQVLMFLLISAGLYVGNFTGYGWSASLIGYAIGLTLAFGCNTLCCYQFAHGRQLKLNN